MLAAEADKAQQILQAEGEAQAIIAVADAKAKALARKSSVVLLSDDKTSASNVVAEAMTIINAINKNNDVSTGVS